jgi:hypothetical protein
MLVKYTQISSLPEDQRARLKATIGRLQLEGYAHFTFEGLTFSKADLLAHFPRNEQQKPPRQPLFG